jgi:hypothetical protein
MTPALRAKIFGRNALKIYPVDAAALQKHVRSDRVTRAREAYREQPTRPSSATDPKTAREYENLLSRG